MTMASSTTSPTVSKLSEKPKSSMTRHAPTSEMGMATSGTSTVRKLPMKRNTISATIAMVSARVFVISAIAFSM